MKQALHIFAKDAWRFNAEIVASLAITLMFVKFYPHAWGFPVGIELYRWVPVTLVALMMVSWFVLIARAMHAETLIGDRQFWVTRPYRWRSLLAAKVLFVLAFVVLPFMAAQCLMLHKAKFHPFAYMPGLLFNTAMTISVIVLPLMLLASITKSFPKMLLGLLFVAMYGAALGYSQDLMPANGSFSNGPSSWWSFVLVFGVMLAVLAYQYATRRTLVTRLLVVAVGLVVFGMAVFSTDDRDINKAYMERQASGLSGVQVVMRPDGDGGVAVDPDNTREVELTLPLDVSGVEAQTAIRADYAKVVIDGPAGQHWESHWQTNDSTWLAGETGDRDSVRLKISRKFYEQMKDVPVTIKLSLALTKLQAGTMTSMTLPEGEFKTPGGSICSNKDGFISELSCRSPLRQPPLMLVAARLSKTPCGSAARIPGETAPSVGWFGTLDTDPAEFDPTAVPDTSFFLLSTSAPNADTGRFLCPGTPMAFVAYTPVEHGQTTVSIQANELRHLTEKLSM